MHAIVETLNRWGAEATALAAATVWQSTLLALLVALLAYALRRSSPSVRYWLWQLVAIKLLVMPFWITSVAVPWLPEQMEPAARAIASAPPALPGANSLSSRRAKIATQPQPATLVASRAHRRKPARATTPLASTAPLSWQGWLLAAWFAMVVFQVGRLCLLRVRLAKLLRSTAPAGEKLVAAVEQVAARLSTNAPGVVTADLDCSPFVCGIVEPVLVLPRELADTLDAGDLDQVLAHELAHLKRRDLIWGWIPEIARIVYFFHPVAYWAGRQVRLERELACDQVAMRDSGRSAADYAAALVRVLSTASCPSVFRTSAASLDGGQPRITPAEPTA